MKRSGDILNLVKELLFRVCLRQPDERLFYLFKVKRDLAKRLRIVVQANLLKLKVGNDLQGGSDHLNVVVCLELF